MGAAAKQPSGKPRPHKGKKQTGAKQGAKPAAYKARHSKGSAGSATKKPAPGIQAGRISKPKHRSDSSRRQASQQVAGKLTKHDKKEKLRDKKAGLKKNFGIIQDAVVLWEALRPKQTSPEEKSALVDQIMGKVDGKLVELASNHTASRVIQFCAKHGTPQQRAKIMEQVKANMVALAKSKYGHHLVRKLINVSTKDQVPDLVRMFQGHMAELLRHPQGADVLVDLYDVAPAPLRNSMCAEFYGREFALFGGVSKQGSALPSLSVLLEGVDASKRRSVMQHMTKALVPVMEKGILHPPMVHRLLRDFLECAPSLSVEDAIDTLSATGASLLKMVHTHDGAAVVCMLLGYGTAKDRKRVVKAMKGHVANMATNEWAYTVLLSALSVVDDTSLTGKTICAELKAMMSDAVEDSHAVRVLLQLLSPYSSRYLSSAVLALLQLPQRTVKGSTGKMVTELEEEEGQDDLQADLLGGKGGDADEDEDLFQPAATGKQQAGSKKAAKQKHPKVTAADEGGEEEGGREEEQQDGERVMGLSKKDPIARRRELLTAGGKESLAASLTSICAAKSGALLRAAASCDLVVEVARGGEQGLLFELVPEGVSAVHEAIVVDAQGEGQQGGVGEGEGLQGSHTPAAEHLFTHYYASRALRRLLLMSAEETAGDGPACKFAELLWTRACKGRCKAWMGGHGEKVLAALLHCGSSTVKAAAAKELTPLVKPQQLQAWSAKFLGGGKHEQHAHSKAQADTAPAAAAGKASVDNQQQHVPAADTKEVVAAGTGKGKKRPAQSTKASTSSQKRKQ